MKQVSQLFIGVIGCIVLLGSFAFATDLSEKYPATLDFSPQSRGYDWNCEATDVWRVKEFSISLGAKFHVDVGAAQVVFGQHQTNALWAAVFPEETGRIAKASAGEGERVTSIWLRFHPATVGDLFPAETVLGQGDAALIGRAKVLAEHKMRSSWHARGRPMVPSKESLIVDAETKEGARRFYAIDTAKSTVQYVDAFRTRTLPVGKSLEEGGAEEIFDKVWNAFDREYAMFVVKPKVDWLKLRDEYRGQAAAAKDSRGLARIISEMLDHLEDLHVYVRVDGDYVPGYNRDRMLNASRDAVEHLIGPHQDTTRNIEWARSKDGIGYINIDGLQDEELPQKFESHLKRMEGTTGLIVDLRFNGGGGEPLAQQVAGYFLDRERVYAKSQYRNGPQHDDLGPQHERSIKPSKTWYYSGPVVVLQGQKTMSSAEAFALMLAQCPNVTTMGDRTAGSSGNPRQIDAGAGIVVNLPRWLALDADGKPFEGIGVQPDVFVRTSPDDFTEDQDPVLSAALRRLREAAKDRADSRSPVLVPRPGTVRATK